MKNVYVVIILLTLMGVSIAEARLLRLSRTEISQKVDCPDALCKRIVKRHLIRDLKGCQIDPELIKLTPQLAGQANLKVVFIHGRTAFLGIIPALYRYHMSLRNKGIVIQANVYFTNRAELNATIIAEMQDKLDAAAAKWNRYNPYPFPLTFQFHITKNRADADVRAKLLLDRDTRGPYFSFWSIRWSASTIAHEMGHVMGLDDEYSNTPFRKLTYCDRGSIMCTAQNPYPYHYYLIVRRMLCNL